MQHIEQVFIGERSSLLFFFSGFSFSSTPIKLSTFHFSPSLFFFFFSLSLFLLLLPLFFQAGVHSGDSACSIPTQTISEKSLATIRDWTPKIARELKVVGEFFFFFLFFFEKKNDEKPNQKTHLNFFFSFYSFFFPFLSNFPLQASSTSSTASRTRTSTSSRPTRAPPAPSPSSPRPSGTLWRPTRRCSCRA